MNEMIEKLRAILTDLGVEPEKIEAAVAELSKEEAPVEEGEGKGEESKTSESTQVEEEVTSTDEGGKPEEGEESVVPPTEEGAVDSESVPLPPESEVVPPVEEGAPVPPVEPETPPVVSLEEFNQVKGELDEVKKALEGLDAQCKSLLEALKAAGVVSGSEVSAVGDGTPSAPGNTVVDTTMDDVLREINTKRY